MKAIVNGSILLDGREVTGRALVFEEKIIGITEPDGVPAGCEVIDAQGLLVSPGLIDLHIHGYVDRDASDGDARGILDMAKALLRAGVTSFLPTTMTLPLPDLDRALEAAAQAMRESESPSFPGSRVLGVHAEGPFINPKRKGAQAEGAIASPDAGFLLRRPGLVRIATVAPEMPGCMECVRELSAHGVTVSIGHSDATFEQAMDAVAAGAGYVTHLFNAMSPMHHRAPGVTGAALASGVYAELIADTQHVHPGLFGMLRKVKGEKLLLVTDCTRAGGIGDGDFTLGGQAIRVRGLSCTLEDGTIAGSVMTLAQAVLSFSSHAGVSLAEAVPHASLYPARAIGLGDQKGSLEPGRDADVALFGGDMKAHAAF
ncbi:MAG TPA: N-acetylglucosamine-6-phosphate deacetylase, partial [Candidatus Limnocylindria bacterium]|nr:N-acetylglucosamine-6-phosphate deacetylase [Candidatus Limnocylindria bacterium]